MITVFFCYKNWIK